MASTNIDAWARDPAADANPQLTRKRQRLSEEAETPPPSSSNSVVIEVLPPDTAGTSLEDAIELHDDDLAMDLYCHTFELDPDIAHLAPAQQLDRLLAALENDNPITSGLIDYLSTWLVDHLNLTQDQDFEAWRTGYTNNSGFFMPLGYAIYAILCKGEIVDAQSLRGSRQTRFTQSVVGFYQALTELSVRIVAILPDVIESSISRRDSVRVSNLRHRVDFLHYVWILHQVLVSRNLPASVLFQNLSGFRPAEFATSEGKNMLADPPILRRFILLLQRLAQHHSQVEQSWDIMGSMLRLMNELDLGTSQDLETILEVCHGALLPVICSRHPRAVSEQFHELCIFSGANSIRKMIGSGEPDLAATLYIRFVQSDHDALLPEFADDASVSELLQTIAHGSTDVLVELLSTAWVLQALKSFISSEIMDLRSIGITLFSNRLLEVHNVHHISKEGVEHPVVQYVARFMRSNELTKYIFGPNSHASLVNHSQNIISFLGASRAYTNLETDIIWHACTHSVEAEFVKAAFGILADLVHYLDVDQLLYLGQKYASTPSTKLGKDAVGPLSGLFEQLRAKDFSTDARRMAIANISIDIMMSFSGLEPHGPALQLRDVARNELLRFTHPQSSAEDRLPIYKRCALQFEKPTMHATTSMEIILMFLRSRITSTESATLLSLIPVGEVVVELCRFVEAIRDRSARIDDLPFAALDLRLETIVRLMDLPGAVVTEEILHSLYLYALGDFALNSEARDSAWLTLNALSAPPSGGSLPSTSRKLLEHFLEVEALGLPLDLMTPRLIQLLGSAQTHKPCLAEDPSQIMEGPIWHKLVHVAGNAQFPAVSQRAIATLCDLLFGWPGLIEVEQVAARCQANFAKQQAEHVWDLFSSAKNSLNESTIGHIVQSLNVLASLVCRSRQAANTDKQARQLELVLHDDGPGPIFSYTLHIHAGHPQPKIVPLQTLQSTRLSELVAKLPEVTGATENRIILGGKFLDLSALADDTLSSIGVGPSNVIPVSPRFTFNSDFGKIMNTPSPVEAQIMEQYSKLEDLLDGPAIIAEKAFELLTMVSPPLSARSRVAAAGAVAMELFPQQNTWKTAFSLFVLKTHLVDFAELGVVDEPFLARGVALLVELLSDDNRPTAMSMWIQALDCLLAFLQNSDAEEIRSRVLEDQTTEPLQSLATHEIIPNPAVFVARVIDMCFEALQDHFQESNIEPRILINGAVQTLLQAFRRQQSTWHHFAEHSRINELHSLLLLDGVPAFTMSVIAQIKYVCQDPTAIEDVADFYTKVVFALLPQALQHQDRAAQYFDFATQILLANRKLGRDETRVQETTQILISTLWQYHHIESVDLPVADEVMLGLLSLLTAAVRILRSFKKALHLQQLAPMLFNRLLFPLYKDTASRPVVNHETRRLAYGLVRSTCETPADFAALLANLSGPLSVANPDPQGKYPGHSHWLRPASRHAGLTNLGMTCYMNSLLQQLFANLRFRKFILRIPTMSVTDQAVLVEVQRLFVALQDDASLTVDTTALAKSLNIQTDSQEDVHGFYADFLSRLEACMPDDESRVALSRFYSGTLISQIKGECGHVSPKTEPFVDLPIIVKNKSSLQDSLEEFVQGEPMEGTNQYKCMACDPENGGRLVNATKRACPEVLPDNLTFCLKRFTWEAMLGFDGKVNDRFDFPQVIDMALYHRSRLENPDLAADKDIFELVGVIVHQGTLNLGHYWSYILVREAGPLHARTWVKVEDKNVSPCADGIEGVQRECFGGQRHPNGTERADNAYVLFYERQTSLAEDVTQGSSAVSNNALLPRVHVPAALGKKVHETNSWRFHIAHLFDEEFALLMECVVEKYRDGILGPTSPTNSASEDDDEEGTNEDSASESAVSKGAALKHLSEAAMLYVQRVAACDSCPGKKLNSFLDGLAILMAEDTKIVPCILRRILDESEWFKRLLTHEDKAVRLAILNLTTRCLTSLQDQDKDSFQEAFDALITTHRSMLNDTRLMPRDWSDYFEFAGALAKLGPRETLSLLDVGYLRWSLEMICACGDTTKKRSPEHLRQKPDKVTVLYEFVYSVLDGHVDLPDGEDLRYTTGAQHVLDERGVHLNEVEIGLLLKAAKKIPLWLSSSKYAEAGSDWLNFAPGKLLGLIMRKTPRLAHDLPSWLAGFIDVEDERLLNLLMMILHFCANCDRSEDAVPVIRSISRTILLWDDPEEFMPFMQEAYRFLPKQVTDHAMLWIPEMLSSRHSKFRRQAVSWLRTVVFASDHVAQLAALDAARGRLARNIADQFWPVLRNAYNRESSRTPYEDRIRALREAKNYLTRMIDHVRTLIEIDDEEEAREKVSKDMMVEYDEASATLQGLEAFDLIEAEWEEEDEPDLPLLPDDDVRRSVEAHSDDFETSDYEGWENDSISGAGA